MLVDDGSRHPTGNVTEVHAFVVIIYPASHERASPWLRTRFGCYVKIRAKEDAHGLAQKPAFHQLM